MELSGAGYPTTINGLETTLPEGKSILPVIRNEIKTQHDTLFWEHVGGKAARVGDWKIAALKDQPWELFNLAKDHTETNNLAEIYPEKVDEMVVLWKDWYKRVN